MLPRRAILTAPLALLAARRASALPLQVLLSSGGVPAALAGMFTEPLAFQRTEAGEYFVFDRRSHSVFRLDARMASPLEIVRIGIAPGQLLTPTAFDSVPDGRFIVADMQGTRERIQLFTRDGTRLSAFLLPARTSPRIRLGNLVVNGIGSLQFTGRSVLLNLPETGSLVVEYGLTGEPMRSFGLLRQTGHEGDTQVHLALNAGIPLVNPRGGFCFVFQTGEPRFRVYDEKGRLRFERAIQGQDLDSTIAALPSRWARRSAKNDLPLVPPIVRAATVDPDGFLWVSFTVPFTYVYDPDGDLIARVQFHAAGIVSPTSLSFAAPGRLLVTPGLYEFRTASISSR